MFCENQLSDRKNCVCKLKHRNDYQNLCIMLNFSRLPQKSVGEYL